MRRILTIRTGGIALVLVLALVLVVGANVQANCRQIDPIVSTDWLEENLNDPDLVILDVRNPDEYAGGHIPGALSSPEWMWYINPPFGPDTPWMELPTVEDLFATIGNAGITDESLVVVVCRTVDSLVYGPAVYAVAGATRVAVTLIYAGLENVAVLDGGYDKWVADGGIPSTDPVIPTPEEYVGDVDEAMFVSMDYVGQRIGRIWRSDIVDGRDVDVYFGVTQEPWTAYPGHIPYATSLPVPWLWDATDYYTYKDIGVLGDMAAGVVGRYAYGWGGFFPREIIVYCGIGGYASTDYFVLSKVLGYRNVKMYDGSAQEWTAAGKPVNLYEWE